LEDYKFFKRLLPALVLELRQAGFMKAEEGKRKSVDNTGADAVNIAMHVGNVGLTDSQPEATPNDPSGGGNHIAPANSNGEKKQEITDFSKTANTKSTHFHEPETTKDCQTKPDFTTSSLHGLGNTPQHSIPTPQILPESG
jgi:hypothetical protein